MIDPCQGCDGSECCSCWRKPDLPHGEKRRRDLERYAARMRAGQTPFFQQRTGRGQWGTGPERRAAAMRGAERRAQ
jgi:hypothetical protein